MSVVLHISDTHFGTDQPAVVDALVALARQQQPDLLVLSGDITQRTRPDQFRAARSFVDQLAAPVLAIPGNHDIPLFDLWTRLVSPYARYAVAFGEVLEPVHTSHDLLVVALLAAATPEQLRVLVVHQPVAVTQASDVANLLRGHAAATRAWSAAGADLVLGGHIHLPYTLALPGLARPLWAGTGGYSGVVAHTPRRTKFSQCSAMGRRRSPEWVLD